MSLLTTRFRTTRNVRSLGRDGDAIQVAMADPDDADTLDALRFAFGGPIRPVPFPTDEPASLVDQLLAKSRDLGAFPRWQEVATRPGSMAARVALPVWGCVLVEYGDEPGMWHAIADVMRRRLEWQGRVWRTLILPASLLLLIVLLHAPQGLAALIVAAAVAVLIEPRPQWTTVARIARKADIVAVASRAGMDNERIAGLIGAGSWVGWLEEVASLSYGDDSGKSGSDWQEIARRLELQARLALAAAGRLYLGLAMLAVFIRWAI